MLALVAAIILLLTAVGALDSTADINYLYLGLAFWAAHFAFSSSLPPWPWERR